MCGFPIVSLAPGSLPGRFSMLAVCQGDFHFFSFSIYTVVLESKANTLFTQTFLTEYDVENLEECLPFWSDLLGEALVDSVAKSHSG